MRFLLLPLFLASVLAGTCVQAQEPCYADYKASRTGPLELQYGVAEIRDGCSVPEAEQELRPRLAADGWQLLEVIATFGESGLEERRESAGEYFLRY